MNYKHPNLFVMIPYEERNRVSGYFDLSVVGEEYGSMSILWAQKVELFSQHNICRENYFLGC